MSSNSYCYCRFVNFQFAVRYVKLDVLKVRIVVAELRFFQSHRIGPGIGLFHFRIAREDDLARIEQCAIGGRLVATRRLLGSIVSVLFLITNNVDRQSSFVDLQHYIIAVFSGLDVVTSSFAAEGCSHGRRIRSNIRAGSRNRINRFIILCGSYCACNARRQLINVLTADFIPHSISRVGLFLAIVNLSVS